MKNNNIVVITPFSMEAVLIYEKLKKSFKELLVYFFDKNLKLDGEKYKDAYVIKPFYLCNAKVIIASDNHRNEISKQLLDLGYDNASIVSLSDFDFDVCNDYEAASMVNLVDFKRIHTDYMGSKLKLIKKLKRMYDIAAFDYTSIDEICGEGEYGANRKEVVEDLIGEKHIFLKRLELDVTSKCSLKCKSCANMMQYYKTPCDIDMNIIISDFRRMIELVDWIDEVMIIGGEPFMYKSLGELLCELRKWNDESKVGRIELITNGTIIPNKEVLNELRASNVMVCISNYGDKSKNIGRLINELCNYGIDYIVMDLSCWYNICQYVDSKDALDEKTLKFWRTNMCETLCRVVDQGKFYLCAHLKSLDQLNAIPKSIKAGCYIDIYEDNAKIKMAQYLSKETPLPEGCSWCNGDTLNMWNDSNKIPVAEQVKNALDYTYYGD